MDVWEEATLPAVAIGGRELEVAHLLSRHPHMHAVHELDAGAVHGLLLVTLDLDHAVDVELLEERDHVGIRDASILGDVVDEAVELLGGLADSVTQTHVSHVRHRRRH